jgi:catechol 2,3-dioxygenase-like lactoylglutathione lyase family enzyme
MGGGVSNYRGLVIARPGLSSPEELRDPDGLSVTLVPPGARGVGTFGVAVATRDRAQLTAFYVAALGAHRDDAGITLGTTRFFVEEDTEASYPSPTWRRGLNYVLVPVDDTAAAHRYLIGHGATHGLRPIRLAERCVFSWLRDPAGNWIELVQYADSGPLPDIGRADALWPVITEWRDNGTPA